MMGLMSNTQIVNIEGVNTPLDNVNHELFCKLYASEREFFGHGTESYIEAYGVDVSKRGARESASAGASKLLLKAMILGRINFFLESQAGLNDSFVDKQMAFLIAQSSDLRTKLAAIREYNTLKGRIKQKIEVSFIDTPDVELDNELEEIEKELQQAQAMQKLRRGTSADDVKGMPDLTEAQRADFSAHTSQEDAIDV